jgi:hypothetical protein
MDFSDFVPYIVFALGVLSRIFLPWLAARKEDPNLSWSWVYIWPQLVTAAVIAMVLPLIVDLAAVADLDLPAAYLAGWGAADVGRTADKLLGFGG